MNILLYSLNYFPEITATGRYTGEMAATLVTQGHKVHVIAGMPHYPEWKIHDDYKVRGFFTEIINEVLIKRVPHYIPANRPVTSVGRMRMELSFILRSLRYWLPIIFSKRKYDVVISVCPPLLTGFFPSLYKMFRQVPYLYHLQDLQVDAAVGLGMIKNKILVSALYKTESFLLNHASTVTTISTAMADKVKNKLSDTSKVSVLPNWASTNVISYQRNGGEFRRISNIPNDVLLILYAGNFGAKQGLEIVIELANRLHECKNIMFVLVGDGAARSDLVEMARQYKLSNLKIMPVQDERILPDMLCEADIHLVVQKDEASDVVMPSKLCNILASGVSCIVTSEKNSSLARLVSDNYMGLAVPADNLDSLASAVITLSNNHDFRRNMGVNAKKYALHYLKKETILSTLERMLLDMRR